MKPVETTLSISQRVALGQSQNSTQGGAIVPFPEGTDFSDPVSLLPAGQRRVLTELLNGGYLLTPYVYHSAEGEAILAVLRFDDPPRRKDIRPLRCERIIGCRGEASMRSIDAPRPLFNLPALTARSSDPVLIVEGEKAAVAAQERFLEYVVSTWPNGSSSVHMADFSPLSGRQVTIWPDNDADGQKAAVAATSAIYAAGATSVKVVQVPADFAAGWDLADAQDAARG